MAEEVDFRACVATTRIPFGDRNEVLEQPHRRVQTQRLASQRSRTLQEWPPDCTRLRQVPLFAQRDATTRSPRRFVLVSACRAGESAATSSARGARASPRAFRPAARRPSGPARPGGHQPAGGRGPSWPTAFAVRPGSPLPVFPTNRHEGAVLHHSPDASPGRRADCCSPAFSAALT